MTDKPYNPLEKINLAKSIERRLLDAAPIALWPMPMSCSGQASMPCITTAASSLTNPFEAMPSPSMSAKPYQKVAVKVGLEPMQAKDEPSPIG